MFFKLSRLFVATGVVLSLMMCCSREKPYNVERCSSVWNGKFLNMKNGIGDTEITRSGDRQIERTRDGRSMEFVVEWIDSCRYSLTPLAGSNPDTTISYNTVIVQITAVTEDSYTIEGWIEGSNIGKYESELVRQR
jgi:hypothetical protein